MIDQFDFLVRLMAVGASMMLLAQLIAGEVRRNIKLPLIATVISVTGYLVNSTQLVMSPEPFEPVINLVSMSAPLWIWLFARHLFERAPHQRIALVAAAFLTLGWFLSSFLPRAGTFGLLMVHFVSLSLIADLVRVAFKGRGDDLVEQRRIIRLWLPLLIGSQAAIILSFELFELLADVEDRFPVVSLINSILILLIILFAGLALLRTDPELLVQSEYDPDLDEPEPLDLNPSETVLHEKLITAMTEGGYRKAGLTIAGLAEQLDTPEHRLRALINQRLGHRNFSAFLNRYRIAEAREKLADRESVDLPVLTIAMDLGYNSLPTFNRAFRTETGTTPSEYRRDAIGSEEPPPIPATPAVQN